MISLLKDWLGKLVGFVNKSKPFEVPEVLDSNQGWK